MKKKIRIIDITPTWEDILPILITLLNDGDKHGRAHARVELQRMAQLADKYVALNKSKK